MLKNIVRGSLLNLLSFKASTKGKVATYQYFADEILTNQERLIITRAFKTLDKEGDGELASKEIWNNLQEHYKPESDDDKVFTESEIDAAINMINLTTNSKDAGTVKYSQFCMAAINENVLINKDKIERLFNLFDFVRIRICCNII